MTDQRIFQAKRMTSAAYCQRVEAFETIAEAKAEAAKLLAQTEKDIESKRAALQVELSQMREDAMSDAETAVEQFIATEKPRRIEDALRETLRLSQAIAEEFEASEDWLTSLVIQAVQRVLSGLPEDQLDLELIRSAVKESGARWKLELHVSPPLHSRIEQLIRHAGSELDCIENVVARQDLKLGQMLLLSAGGITDLTVDVQLDALAGVIRSACSSKETEE